MTRLTSPGTALSDRHEAELELQAQLAADLEVLLHGVLLDARAALDAPMLLAAGIGRQDRPEPFTLGRVLRRWSALVSSTVASLSKLLTGNAPDLYLTQASARLLASGLPTEIYDSTRAVLVSSQTQGWDGEATRKVLARALDPATSSMMFTTEGAQPTGPSWSALVRRIARTEATAAVGHRTMHELAAAGFPRKRWVAHHDAFVRPEHLDADGREVPVGADFLVGGLALAYPGDPSAPHAMTANCRCVIVGSR